MTGSRRCCSRTTSLGTRGTLSSPPTATSMCSPSRSSVRIFPSPTPLSQLVRVDPSTGSASVLQVLRFLDTSFVVEPGGGAVLVSNASGGTTGGIRRVDLSTGAVQELSFGQTINITLEADGNVLACLVGQSTLERLDPVALTLMPTGIPVDNMSSLSGTFGVLRSECSDFLDNDGDGSADFPADSKCTDAADVREFADACGLIGLEPPVVVACALGIRRRRRRRRM